MHYDAQDLHITALTLLGEARGEPELGKIAVGWVIRNRCEDPRWPSIPAEVCKQDWQFSCWLDMDWNRGNLHYMASADWDDDAYRECYAIAAAVFEGLVESPVRGANHYHAKSVEPDWTAGAVQSAVIGNHVFWRL